MRNINMFFLTHAGHQGLALKLKMKAKR